MNNRSFATLAMRTLWYSVVLAAIMEVAHVSVRLALAAMFSLAALPNVIALAAELAQKITWSTLICEAVVFASIVARRRGLLLMIFALVATLIAILVGDYLFALIEWLAAQVSSFDWAAFVADAVFRAGKYLFLGAALAVVNRLSEPVLRHYALAGTFAALVAIALTLVVHASAPLVTLGSEVVIELIFPFGCSLVVWKVRQLAAPLIETHQAYRTQLRRV